MSRAAKSLFFFGLYVISLGVFLVVAPNVLLKIFNVSETNEVWIRVVGVLVLIIGYYYVRAATDKKDMSNFYRWTIYARTSVLVFFVVFVLLDFVKPALILFGVFDFAGAVWTALALRSSEK